MKKAALVLISAFVAIGLYLGLSSPSKKELSPDSLSPDVLGVPTENEGVELSYQGKIYKAYYLKVPYAGEITLIPNFSETLSSSEIAKANNCKAVISGGFYTPEGNPTGLFISEGETRKSFVSSSLANAVYSINDFETPRITPQTPRDHLRVALQAGPLLIENSFVKDLSLIRDETARRVVVGVTGDNESVFMVIYDPTSSFMGPTLKSLPDLLELFQKQTSIELADAMNLDGGAHSAFFSVESILSEASSVGSFFCVK